MITRRRYMGKHDTTPYDAQVTYIDKYGMYITTDLDPSLVHGIDIKMSLDNKAGHVIMKSDVNFSCYQNGGNSACVLVLQGTAYATSSPLMNYGSYLRIYSSADLNTIYVVGNSTKSVTTNGVAFASSSGSIIIGGGSGDSYGNIYNRYVYYAKFYDSNGDLIFDGIPVRKGDYGGLYDNIAGKLYQWDGTGGFGYGSDVE